MGSARRAAGQSEILGEENTPPLSSTGAVHREPLWGSFGCSCKALHPFRVHYLGYPLSRGCALRAYPGLYSLHAFSVLKYKPSLGAECCLIDNASCEWTMVNPSGVRLD